MADKDWDFTGLKALFFNGTLSKSPEPSHTDRLIEVSTGIMQKHDVETEVIRTIDHPDIATGVW
ncbi:MAG TPA: flavodoxin family protein, partial [Verrucomicrobiae bacterium]|nr:flavodoxin family protein [Verrucomicrobiae bacterium]